MYYTTRHKERIALIEKDKDVSLFYSAKPTRASSQVGKIIILNIALTSIGIGLGILLGRALVAITGMEEEIAITASIFLTAGIGLLVGFYVMKKEAKAEVL